MKKILFFLLLLSSVASAQRPPNYTKLNNRYDYISIQLDSSARMPVYGGVPVGVRVNEQNRAGGIAVDTLNHDLYYFTDSTWRTYVSAVFKSGNSVYYAKGPDDFLAFTDSVGLAPADTANKWVTSVYRKTASDSVFFVKGGVSIFGFIDSTGSAGVNIYTDDGTIEEERTVNGAGLGLQFNDMRLYGIVTDSFKLNTTRFVWEGVQTSPGTHDVRWDAVNNRLTVSDTMAFGGKLNISDTSAMLDPYLRTTGDLSPLFTTTETAHNTSFTQISQLQNLVFASPNGSSGNPTFRALVAADLPALTGSYWGVTGNTGLSATINYIGTHDSVDFVIRTDSVERVRVPALGGMTVSSTAYGNLLDINNTGNVTIGDIGGSVNSTYINIIDPTSSIEYFASAGHTFTGNVILTNGVSSGEMRILEPSGSGTNYTAFKTVAQATSLIYSLPPAYVAGGALTDVAGDGVLTWVVPSGGAAQTLSFSGTTSPLVTLSDGGGSFSITGAGIAVMSRSGNAFTVTATEVGTVQSFTFTDGSGFDGTVTNSTTTPTLALTTTVADTRVMYSTSGAVTGSSQMTFTGQALQLASTNTTQATTSAAFAQTYNSLTSGTGQYIASSSLAGGKLLDLVVTGTAAAGDQTAFKIDVSGANASSSITTYGMSVTNRHSGTTPTNIAGYFESYTGAGTNRAIYATVSGAGTLNEAGTFNASGTATTNRAINATASGSAANMAALFSAAGAHTTNTGVSISVGNATNNYALITSGGNVGIGNGTPTSYLEVLVPNSFTTGIAAKISSDFLSSGTLLDLTSTGTAKSGANEVLNIVSSGANGTNAITVTGGRISVTNTNATSGTNVGLDITATGATTANYTLKLTDGAQGVGKVLTSDASGNASWATLGRYTPQVVSAASYTTSTTINADVTDLYVITAQAGDLLFNAPTGTIAHGQKLTIRVKGDGTNRTATWNSVFRGSTSLPLPSTIRGTYYAYWGFVYNTTDTKWDYVAQIYLD